MARRRLVLVGVAVAVAAVAVGATVGVMRDVSAAKASTFAVAGEGLSRSSATLSTATKRLDSESAAARSAVSVSGELGKLVRESSVLPSSVASTAGVAAQAVTTASAAHRVDPTVPSVVAPSNGWDLRGWDAAVAKVRAATSAVNARSSTTTDQAAAVSRTVDRLRSSWVTAAKSVPALDAKLTAHGTSVARTKSATAARKLQTIDPLSAAGVAAWKTWLVDLKAAQASAHHSKAKASTTAGSSGGSSAGSTGGAFSSSSSSSSYSASTSHTSSGTSSHTSSGTSFHTSSGSSSHTSSGSSKSSGGSSSSSGGGSSAAPSCYGNQEHACVKTPPTFATNGNYVSWATCQAEGYSAYMSHDVGYGGRSLSGTSISAPWSAYVSGPTVYYVICG